MRSEREARQTPSRRKRLKPTGHSAAIEALIQPAIVAGSTLMSAIAAYVLALDEITRVLDGRGAPADIFVIVLCAGMGFLIDMAIIVSATRYKMHAVRGDPREQRWLQLAKWVLGIGLTSEAMTLFYFFVHLDPSAFPPFLEWLAALIHAVLAVSRAFLPPVVIAYFAAGVLPVAFDRADRNREIKSRTSSNIMQLIDRLSEVFDTDDKAEMLRALGGQLMLDTYATYDETARTSEDQQLRRDAKLLAHLARIHRLDWSAIAADVAPELATPRDTGNPLARSADPRASEDSGVDPEPTPEPDPERPSGRRRVAAQGDAAQEDSGPIPTAFNRRTGTGDAAAAQEPPPAAAQHDLARPRRRVGGRVTSGASGAARRAVASYGRHAREALRANRLEQTIALLTSHPEISVKALARALHSGEGTAKGLRARALQLIAQRASQRAVNS